MTRRSTINKRGNKLGVCKCVPVAHVPTCITESNFILYWLLKIMKIIRTKKYNLSISDNLDNLHTQMSNEHRKITNIRWHLIVNSRHCKKRPITFNERIERCYCFFTHYEFVTIYKALNGLNREAFENKFYITVMWFREFE